MDLADALDAAYHGDWGPLFEGQQEKWWDFVVEAGIAKAEGVAIRFALENDGGIPCYGWMAFKFTDDYQALETDGIYMPDEENPTSAVPVELEGWPLFAISTEHLDDDPRPTEVIDQLAGPERPDAP